MIEWIESQSVAAIAFLVFGFCYALAASVLAAGMAVAARPIASALKATTPTMMTPVSVIAGLLIAFLATRVWTNLDRANSLVAQEASAIRESTLLANALPDDVRTTLKGAIHTYLSFVEAEDFPAMAANRASLRPPPGLTDAMSALLAFRPAGPGQHIQQRAVSAVERALEARRSRVLLSRTAISSVQWLVVVILDTLILLIIAMVHVDRWITTAVNLFIFSTAIAACLVLLMVNDRPFAAGGFTVQPSALRELANE
jgi:hypothetical protein